MKVKELIEELKTFDPEQDFGIIVKRGSKEGETIYSLEEPEEIVSGPCFSLEGHLFFDEQEIRSALDRLFQDFFGSLDKGSGDVWVRASLEEACFKKGLVYMTVWV